MAPVAPAHLGLALEVLHYAYPALIATYFFTALTVTVCTLQSTLLRIRDQHVRRDVLLGTVLAVTLTYLAEGIIILVRKALEDGWSPREDYVVYLLTCAVMFATQTVILTDSKFPVWYPYYGTWFLGLGVESVLLVLPNVFQPPGGPNGSPFDYPAIVVQALRVGLFIMLPSLYFGLRNDQKEYENVDAEQQSLLRKKLAPGPMSSEDSAVTDNGYGTTNANDHGSETADDASDAESEDSFLESQRKGQDMIDKRLQQDGNWFAYAKGFTIFFPYIWPSNSKMLQLRALLVGLCLLSTNALNVLVPWTFGRILDGCTEYRDENNGNVMTLVYIPLIVYVLLRLIAGGSGIGWLKKWLWMPLEQYSYDALSTASHAHLMNLSSDFHDSKTSSDLTQAVSGGRSVADLLDTVCFQVIPMFIDLAVAFTYLWSVYGPFMGLVMASTVVTYLYVTTKLISRRAGKRRDYVTICRKEWTVGQQSLDGWVTATLFNMIPYERSRYATAVKDHMRSRGSYEMTSQGISAVQALVMSAGLLGALFLGIHQIVTKDKSVGQFATLIIYWGNLQSPLVFFSTIYRQISYNLMDAERLLELFQTKPTIVDSATAKSLKLTEGHVRFEGVTFAYDERRPTLKNVSFDVPPGKTVALVGETGGGKSTILKLLHRFYDVKSGSITIDGQDIRNVTLESLRANIGIVPQDPMLFNDSIMSNIRYSRMSASDSEVYEACKAAAVHNKIMSFPDGYSSKVGDRGVKLSGGEKQRVAIARAILKQPEIILLDEATSAVDTETEQLIQEGFKTLCKDRTTFIVAHRLSTIMQADRILVVMDGEVIEEGTHENLIRSGGKYSDLWSKQSFVNPKEGSSRSRSPKKRDASIINDLTPRRSAAELAKANAANNSILVGQQNETSTVDTKKSPNGHKREGSRLKPDAPIFVPSTPSPLKPIEPIPKDVPKTEKKEEKRVVSLFRKSGRKLSGSKQSVRPNMVKAFSADSAHSVAHSRSPISSSPMTQSPKNEVAEAFNSAAEMAKSKQSRFSEGTKTTKVDSQQNADSFKVQTIGGSSLATPIERVKPKRNRFSRRHIAKSEPANRAHESLDGQQEHDVSPIGSSGEFQPLTAAAQRRRVSAPSDPPSGLLDSKNPRARRNRHWRVKNRMAETTGSGSACSGSGRASTSTSGEHSVDEVAEMGGPVSSPAGGIGIPIDRQSTRSVKSNVGTKVTWGPASLEGVTFMKASKGAGSVPGRGS